MKMLIALLIAATTFCFYEPCHGQSISTVSNVVFRGLPLKKDMSDFEGTEQVSLEGKDRVEYRLIITKQGRKFFWESRENHELLISRSGEFYNFVDPKGAGYIRIAKVEGKLFYMEHLTIGFKNITYWGYAVESNLD